MAESYVIDTHVLLWYLTASPRLSPTAKELLDRCGTQGVEVLVSAITVAELYYLCRKTRQPLDLKEYLEQLRSADVKLVPLEAHDVLLFDEFNSIPEMHDRIIAGVALKHNATIVTRDQEIRASEKVRTVW